MSLQKVTDRNNRMVTRPSWRFILFLMFFAAGMGHPLFAQVFPVQGNAVLVPPYSLHLADYTSGINDRIILNIVLNNTTRPELDVKLRLSVKSKGVVMETKQTYLPKRITLQGGIPLRLTGADLQEYFLSQNLNFAGIDQKAFEKTGLLPEGFYQFCFEVLEYNRGVKISNTICAQGWLILNDPPIVNLPRNNTKLRPSLPQNVVLQWTPRHTGSPNSAFTTNYELTMVEVWPANRNPNDAILASTPILQTTTTSTSFIFGPAETPLELGRTYAFRVRAQSSSGGQDFDLFKNNGYSEVFSFVYGDVCECPLNISAFAMGPAKVRAKWDSKENHTAFNIRYREAGKTSAAWFSSNALINEVELNSLKSNTSYEYQVSGVCGPFESVYSTSGTVKTNSPPPAEYSCGLQMEKYTLDASSLLATLNPGDIILAGDFQVQLTRVRGSNGIFSGEGAVVVPFLNNVKVKAVFEDIMVNKDNRLVKGSMNVTGAAIDIIPDEVTALMDDLDATLDKVDETITKVEDVVTQIDDVVDATQEVIEELKTYLPEEIIKELESSKAEIIQAKAELKAATTSPAKEEAKVEVRKAKDKMRDATGKALEYYAKAIKDIIQIVKEAMQEVVKENEASIAEGEKTLAAEEVNLKTHAKQQTEERQKVSFNAGGEGGDFEHVFVLDLGNDSRMISKAEEENIKKLSASKGKMMNSINEVVRVGRPLIKAILLNKKLMIILTEGEPALKNFVDDVRKNSEELLKNIMMDLKANNKEAAKKKVKEFIKTTVA